jgi:hypothetical protein
MSCACCGLTLRHFCYSHEPMANTHLRLTLCRAPLTLILDERVKMRAVINFTASELADIEIKEADAIPASPPENLTEYEDDVAQWAANYHFRTGVALHTSAAPSDYDGSYDSQSGEPTRVYPARTEHRPVP